MIWPIHLVQLIKEQHRRYSNVDGLMVLLDPCHAGVGAAEAAAKWVGELGGTLRFEVLTATNERTAADGCFSRNIVAIIRKGIDRASAYIRCEKAREILLKRCPNQRPQLPTYNPDEGFIWRGTSQCGASRGRASKPPPRKWSG
jgi:hypothetical protein